MALLEVNMAIANQYGINLGEIEKTVSDLKTAKLRREKLEYDKESREAGDEYYGNYLSKKDKSSIVEPTDENEDGEIDAAEKKNALRKTGMKFNAFSKTKDRDEKSADRASQIHRRNVLNGATIAAENRAAAKDAARIQREKEEDAALEKFYIKNGASPEEAKNNVLVGAKNAKAALNVYEKQNEIERTQTKQGLNKAGAELGQMIQEADEDPQGVEQKYQKKRESLLKRENDLRKAEMKSKADEVGERIRQMPETILVNGQINKTYLTGSLANTQRLAASMEEVDKSKKDKPTFSQTKTNERANIKYATDSLKDDIGELSPEAKKIVSRVSDLSLLHPKWSSSKTLREAKKQIGGKKTKRLSVENPVKYQISPDGTQIFNGKEYVPYDKKK